MKTSFGQIQETTIQSGKLNFCIPFVQSITKPWLMARHADPAKVPDSPEEFLDQFNTFSIYQILPQLIELWGLNVQTEVESRKNLEKVSGK